MKQVQPSPSPLSSSSSSSPPPLPSFAWVESAPGVWQRDVDEVETFWAHAARTYDTQGRKRFMITGHVSLRIRTDNININNNDVATRGLDINIALRKAWCRIRQDHPSVASRVDYNFDTEKFTRTYHTVRNHVEREEWLNSTFIETLDGNVQSSADFANSDPVAPDLPAIFVITPSSSSKVDIDHDGDDDDGDDDEGTFEYRDIFLRAPHDTIDGVGTLQLFSSLVQHASSALEFEFELREEEYPMPELHGTEIHNLSPPYRVAAAVPQQLSPAQRATAEAMLSSEHVYFSQAHSHEARRYLSLPFKQGAQVAGRHQRTEITLNWQHTSDLLAACKALGVTVTHALHAAIPIVLRDLKTPYDDGRQQQQPLYYRCDLLRNLRPFCTPPFNTPKHPVTAYHAGSRFGFETEVSLDRDRDPERDPGDEQSQSSKKEYRRLLQEIRAFYRRVADDVDHAHLAPQLWARWLQTLPKLEKDPVRGPPPSPAPSVTLSSLGRADEMVPPEIGRFHVSKPWVTGEELGNGYGLFLISHRGRLNLAAAYNDAWQGEEAAQEFLWACIRVLSVSLDVEL